MSKKIEKTKVFSHFSFATKMKEDTLSIPKESQTKLLRGSVSNEPHVLPAAVSNSVYTSTNTAENRITPATPGQIPTTIHAEDVGADIRVKRRREVIANAHSSLARHTLSVGEKLRHQDLFQNRLRLDHNTGKYVDANWADPTIPVTGVGLALEQVIIPSLLLPTSVMSELRVSSMNPDGAAALSKRIKLGDILVKARNFIFKSIHVTYGQVGDEDTRGQSPAQVLSKISGPDGSVVVLGLKSGTTGHFFSLSLVRGNSSRSVVTRIRLQSKIWPDPNLYDETSILRMGLDNCFRQLAIHLIESRFWNVLVLFSIGLSIMSMPFDDPLESGRVHVFRNYSIKTEIIDFLDALLTLVFILDVGFKVVAMGFWMGQRAYMRDIFNRLDFVLAVLGLLDSYSSSSQPGINAIRAIRALRPLKAINRFQNLKTFIKLLFVARDKLQNAAIVVVFVLFMFTIVSVQLFVGVLRQKCFHVERGYILANNRPCSISKQSCPYDFACVNIGGNVPGRTRMNSDNFLFALLVNIRTLTLSSWSEMMYSYMISFHPAASIFFIVQIFCLPLYCVQIFLGIIGIEIEPLQDFKLQRALLWGVQHWKPDRRLTVAPSFNTWKHWTGLRPLIVKLVVQAKLKRVGIRRGKDLARIAFNCMFRKVLWRVWDHWKQLIDDLHDALNSSPEYMRVKLLSAINAKKKEERESMKEDELDFKAQLNMVADRFRVVFHTDGRRTMPFFRISIPNWVPVSLVVRCLKTLRVVNLWRLSFQRTLYRFASHDNLEALVAFSVLASTVFMCLEHSRNSVIGKLWGSGRNGDVRHVRFQAQMEVGYISFIAFYILEMGFKITGLGITGYFKVPGNVLDAVLVLVSFGQISDNVAYFLCTSRADSIEDCDDNSSRLAALRVIRLIRVIRSFKQVSIIQAQLRTVVSVAMQSYSLIIIFTVFVFVFAALGTQLFFGSMSTPIVDARAVGVGSLLWLEIPLLPIPTFLPGRPGLVYNIDRNMSLHPWDVNLVTSFAELGTRIGTAKACLGIGCNVTIVSGLPRAHFVSFSQSMLTVLQIMLISGWVEIFENLVSEAGYGFPCLFFGSILFIWSYFLGNICFAVLIVGFSKKFDDEKKALQQMALKSKKVQALHRRFKEALMSEYLRRVNAQVQQPNLTIDSIRERRQRMNAEIMKFRDVGVNKKDQSTLLIHDPFQPADQDNRQDAFYRIRKYLRNEPEIDENVHFLARLVRDSEEIHSKTTDREMGTITNEIEIRKIQDSLLTMSNFEREMYIREGLNSLQIGRHLAVTLGIAVMLLRRRLDQLKELRNASPGPQHAAYYDNMIRPMQGQLKVIEQRVFALRFGHQIGISLCVLRPYHPLRIYACRLIHNSWFERVMLSMVIGSCTTLWVQRPEMTLQQQDLMDYVNTGFNFCFLFECILKVTAYNMREYLRDGFNRLDFFIVLLSIVDEGTKFGSVSNNNPVLQALKVLRAIRPLRVLSRFEALKFLGALTGRATSMIMRAGLFSLIMIVGFGLLGQQFFIGKMNTCTDAFIFKKEDCFGQFPGSSKVRKWVTLTNNFDWIGQSIFSAYQVATSDTWYVTMHRGIDSTGLKTGAWVNAHRELSIFFVFLVMVGRFVIQPYFGAVFLEAYLAAFYQRKVSNEIKEWSLVLGKPTRKQTKNFIDAYDAQASMNFFQVWLVLTRFLSLSEFDNPPAWVAMQKTSERLPVLLFCGTGGWRPFLAVPLPDMLLLFDPDDSSLRHAVHLCSASMRVLRTVDLDGEGLAGLGVTARPMVVKIEQALVGKNVGRAGQYRWWQVAHHCWIDFVPAKRDE